MTTVPEELADVHSKHGFNGYDASIEIVRKEIENLDLHPEIEQCGEHFDDWSTLSTSSTTHNNAEDEDEMLMSRTTERCSNEDTPPASTSGQMFTKDDAIALHKELGHQLSMPRFAKRMRSLLAKGPMLDVAEKRLKLIYEVEQKAISLHNFETTDEGVKFIRELCQSWRSDSDVDLLYKAIRKDFNIDAFGDNPDIALANTMLLPGGNATQTLEALLSVNQALVSPDFYRNLSSRRTRTGSAVTNHATQVACQAKEAADKVAKKAAPHEVCVRKRYNSRRAATAETAAEEVAPHEVGSQRRYNSQHAAAVAKCLRG